MKDQILAKSIGTAEVTANYMNAVVAARSTLDHTYEPANQFFESIASSSPEMAAKTDALFKGIFASASPAPSQTTSSTTTKPEPGYDGMKRGLLSQLIYTRGAALFGVPRI